MGHRADHCHAVGPGVEQLWDSGGGDAGDGDHRNVHRGSHFLHPGRSQRIGQPGLGGGGIHRADPHVGGAVGLVATGGVGVSGGAPHQPVGAEQAPQRCHRKVVGAAVDPVGPRGHGDVGPVVHDHHGVGGLGRSHDAPALGQHCGVARPLDPHLHRGRPAPKGGVGQRGAVGDDVQPGHDQLQDPAE